MKKEDTINPFNINNKKEKNEELEEKEDDEYYYNNLLLYNKKFNIGRNIIWKKNMYLELKLI